MRLVLMLLVICCLSAGLGCKKSPSLGEMLYEEQINKAEYEGRHDDAERLREKARKAKEDDNRYQRWKASNKR